MSPLLTQYLLMALMKYPTLLYVVLLFDFLDRSNKISTWIWIYFPISRLDVNLSSHVSIERPILHVILYNNKNCGYVNYCDRWWQVFVILFGWLHCIIIEVEWGKWHVDLSRHF